ncbi:MAG: family 43 glycosylhydrolase, partial [Bifidobacteriaceae bacterium]|nr:family 43 glycosylhydrolase [Bifidobacteriaceae bacterium]
MQHKHRGLISLAAAAALVGTMLGTGPAALAESPNPYPSVPPTVTWHSDGNPILYDAATQTPGLGQTSYFSADAATFVDNGVLYIYAGHDEASTSTGDFRMYNYGVFATTDVEGGDWSLWYQNLVPTTVFPDWANGQRAFAGAVVKDPVTNKYYWYVPVQTNSTDTASTHGNNMAIGVAVSDTPVGPWTDARKTDTTPGTPILDYAGLYGTTLSQGEIIDPHVMIDPDTDRVWLYWGGAASARVIEMDRDMIHIKAGATAQTLSIPSGRFYEAPWVFKKNGIYYYVYDWKYGAIGQCTPSNYQACI